MDGIGLSWLEEEQSNDMKVLVLYSGNTESPFITEQVDDIQKLGVQTQYYRIVGNGIIGYLKSLKGLKKIISDFSPDIVHAHFGLSGVLANLQGKAPVVTTYHGCDINKFSLRLLSLPSLLLSRFNIFVSQSQYGKVKYLIRNDFQVIPCGINLNSFYPMDKIEARKNLGLELDKKYILFSSAFDIPVKNAKLAIKAVNLLDDNYKLIELKSYSREEVNLLMNACDVGLLTSIREGSPMFVKELLATNTPVVSTDVGDVKEKISKVNASFIADNNPEDIAAKIVLSCNFKQSNGRDAISDLEGMLIAKRIVSIYEKVTS